MVARKYSKDLQGKDLKKVIAHQDSMSQGTLVSRRFDSTGGRKEPNHQKLHRLTLSPHSGKLSLASRQVQSLFFLLHPGLNLGRLDPACFGGSKRKNWFQDFQRVPNALTRKCL